MGVWLARLLLAGAGGLQTACRAWHCKSSKMEITMQRLKLPVCAQQQQQPITVIQLAPSPSNQQASEQQTAPERV